MAKPTKCIPVADAKQLHQNWITTRAVEIKKAMGSEDVRDVFFTVAELEEYLTYVKAESLKQGFSTPGIRIYFAAYNDESSTKATVFLAPTVGNIKTSAANYNIDPLNRGGQGWPPHNY